MDRRELLSIVKERAELENLRQADHAVRAVVGVLKGFLSEELAEEVKNCLPDDLRLGWETVEQFPHDIIEKEEYYFGGVEPGDKNAPPTITDG